MAFPNDDVPSIDSSSAGVTSQSTGVNAVPAPIRHYLRECNAHIDQKSPFSVDVTSQNRLRESKGCIDKNSPFGCAGDETDGKSSFDRHFVAPVVFLFVLLKRLYWYASGQKANFIKSHQQKTEAHGVR
jgi:hypothetical protein